MAGRDGQNGAMPAENAGGSNGMQGQTAIQSSAGMPIGSLYAHEDPITSAYTRPFPTEATFGGPPPYPRNTPNYPAWGAFGQAVNVAKQREIMFASMDAQKHPGIPGATETYTYPVYGPQTFMIPQGQRAQQSQAVAGPTLLREVSLS